MIKKILKIISVSLLALVLLAAAYIYFAVPTLSKESEQLIAQAIQSPLDPLSGEEGFAYNGETKIWYHVRTPRDSVKGNIIFAMGIANDALAWPGYFMDPLVANDYRLITFDNRGTGLTDWVEDWEADNAYSLEDIAADGIAVLDHLGIDQAHVIGVSMGGMIAQSMSIHYPERILSLTSMMSSGNMMDQDLPSIHTAILKDLILAQLRYGLIKSEANEVRLQIRSRQLLMGTYPYKLDVEDISQTVLYNLRKRNGYNPNASRQHLQATMISGSRYEQLQNLKLPTLLIHGEADPLINIAHGKKCLELIPHADYLWIKEMGHDVPPRFAGQVVDKILAHLE